MFGSSSGSGGSTSQQLPVSGGGGGGFGFASGGSPTTGREANVFKSGIFQPIKQERFIRPDAPLTRIQETPSDFPSLAELGQIGLAGQGKQNRGLIAN